MQTPRARKPSNALAYGRTEMLRAIGLDRMTLMVRNLTRRCYAYCRWRVEVELTFPPRVRHQHLEMVSQKVAANLDEAVLGRRPDMNRFNANLGFIRMSYYSAQLCSGSGIVHMHV